MTAIDSTNTVGQTLAAHPDWPNKPYTVRVAFELPDGSVAQQDTEVTPTVMGLSGDPAGVAALVGNGIITPAGAPWADVPAFVVDRAHLARLVAAPGVSVPPVAGSITDTQR